MSYDPHPFKTCAICLLQMVVGFVFIIGTFFVIMEIYKKLGGVIDVTRWGH